MKIYRIILLSKILLLLVVIQLQSQGIIDNKYYLVKHSQGRYIFHINENYQKPNEINRFSCNIYPNPTKEEITVSINVKDGNPSEAKILLLENNEKKMIWKGVVTKGENKIFIKDSKLLQNSKLIIIEYSGQTKSINLIK
jgi:hypothetical protein